MSRACRGDVIDSTNIFKVLLWYMGGNAHQPSYSRKVLWSGNILYLKMELENSENSEIRKMFCLCSAENCSKRTHKRISDTVFQSLASINDFYYHRGPVRMNGECPTTQKVRKTSKKKVFQSRHGDVIEQWNFWNRRKTPMWRKYSQLHKSRKVWEFRKSPQSYSRCSPSFWIRFSSFDVQNFHFRNAVCWKDHIWGIPSLGILEEYN